MRRPRLAGDRGARAERERELLRRVREDGDLAAREALAMEMLPLARALASRFAGRGEPLDDLVQVACVGLMKAIDGYDPAREARFSSYATPTVIGEIKRYFRDKTWAVRVPRRVQDLQIRIARAREKLTTELGRPPTPVELIAAVDAPAGEVLAVINSVNVRQARSLDESLGEHGTLGDTLGGVDPELERAEIRAVLDRAFAVLSERDQQILRLRFEYDLTQAAVARLVGLSQMQVSRLITQSVARVRMRIEHTPVPEWGRGRSPRPIPLPVRRQPLRVAAEAEAEERRAA